MVEFGLSLEQPRLNGPAMTAVRSGRALVFGDDMRIFLAIARSLGRAGIEVHSVPFNWQAPALRSRYVAKWHRVPRHSDSPEAWQAAIAALAKEYSFDILIPCCDRAIIALDQSRERLSGHRLAIPDGAAMTLLFDKERTRQLSLELGVSVANAARLRPSDTAGALVAQFGLPLVIKPRRSFWADQLDFWGKAAILDREEDVAAFLDHVTGHDRYQVESFFTGVGVGISVLANEGRIIQAFQHRRLREGRAGASSYRISEALHPEMREACAKICRRTGYTGVCMFEFRYDPQAGDWILIETNARFWGSMALPLSLGVDFPRFLCELMTEGRECRQVDYRTGTKSRNFVLDGFNIVGQLRGLRAGNLGAWLRDAGDFLLQPTRWLAGTERSDSFVSDDLKPALWECAGMARIMAGKLRRNRTAPPKRRRSDQSTRRPVMPA